MWKGERGIICLLLHCHHLKDSCIKMGYLRMGKSYPHFNVSLTVRIKVRRLCPQTTTFEENESCSVDSN